jgi:pimeloyl-ACP methyl ester carboxylesterase
VTSPSLCNIDIKTGCYMIRLARFLIAVVILAFALVQFSGCGSSQEDILKKYASGESKFIDIDGLKVHYRDEGKGPVLLCLHGVQSSLHTWDGWVNLLKHKYRIIRIDLPGWGFTGRSNFGYNGKDTAKFLKKFIDAKGIKKLSLAGNSYGGFVSWNFTRDYPATVEKLILLDAGGYPFKAPLPVVLLTTPIIRNMAYLITPSFILKFIVADSVRDVYGTRSRVTQDTIDRYFDLMMYNGNLKESVTVFLAIQKTLETEPAGVNTIKVPTLIMWGKEDRWIPLHVMERFKKDIPHARVILYEGAGHIPMEEIPEVTAKDADAFLSVR